MRFSEKGIDMANDKKLGAPEGYTIKKSGPALRIISTILLIVWSIINLYPLFWMVMLSLKNNEQVNLTHKFGLPAGWPNKWHWENYTNPELHLERIVTYFKNSVIVTVLAIAIALVAAMMASYALMRFNWRASGAINKMFMLGITVPVQVSLVPLLITTSELGITGSRISLIIPYAAFSLSMAILISNGFMTNIPKELDEAAYIDGCSRYGVFFRIILPLMTPAISTIGIYSFLQCWNELIIATTLVTTEEMRTLPIGIRNLVGTNKVDYGLIGAGITIATIPMIIVYILMSRKIQESFIAGAVKG